MLLVLEPHGSEVDGAPSLMGHWQDAWVHGERGR